MNNLVITVQHEIVRRGEVAVFGSPKTDLRRTLWILRALFARADAIEREVADASKRAEAMTQAVLGKAFCGKL